MYEKQNFKTGDVLTADALNHMEEGIEKAMKAGGGVTLITWAELKALRDASGLKPGAFYRITDYVTTTIQENTRSARHPFDIIVLAISENELSEEAYAGFASFNIERYKDAYSPTWDSFMNYKGVYDYNGNQYHLFESEDKTMQMLVDFSNYEMESFEPYDPYPYSHEPKYTRYIEDGVVGEWIVGGDGESLSFKASVNVNFFKSHSVNLSAWKIRYCLDNDAERFAWADAENGKGVICRMIDEWNNDVPYDFKSIVFKKEVDGEETYIPTFADDLAGGSKGNKMMPCLSDNTSRWELPFNTLGEQCCQNFFDGGSKRNTLKDYVSSCRLGKFATDNTLQVDCSLIELGDFVKQCDLYDKSTNIRVGNGSYGITSADMVVNSSIGSACRNISFEAASSYIDIVAGVLNLDMVGSNSNVRVQSPGNYAQKEIYKADNMCVGFDSDGNLVKKNLFD